MSLFEIYLINVKRSISTFLLSIFVLLFLAILTSGCDEKEDVDVQLSVTITTVGLSDSKLALNNTATFTAEVNGYEDDISNLSYRWTLSTWRGGFTDGTNALPNSTVGGSSILCIGKTAGEETIIVAVLDGGGNTIASATIDFTIVTSIDPGESRGCYDGPKIVYQRGVSFYVCNYDGSGETSIGISGQLSVDISPDGEWIAWNAYEIEDNPPIGYSMYVGRCDGTDIVRIPSGIVGFEKDALDYIPHFSHDSKSLYFIRPDLASEPVVVNSQGPFELVAYELETGNVSYLTSLYLKKESVKEFTVSPVTGEIAFIRQTYDIDATEYVTTLAILKPETGFTQDLTTLPSAQFRGMDWSSDGQDIIYSASTSNERGIFRIKHTSGSQPLLLYAHTTPNTTPPGYPHYYANDTRIVMQGQLNGTSSYNLWTIDANGNDLQQLTDVPQAVFMQSVLH